MPATVNSKSNKILLAQILQNHPLASANNATFQQLIIQETERIHRQRFQFHSDLTLMNKEIIKRITDIGKKMSAAQKKASLPPTPPVSKNFELRLKEQQENFLKLVNPSKPKDIDFSDKITEGAIPTIDATLQQREKELRTIMKDYENDAKAKEWIENEAVNGITVSNISDNTITINPAPTPAIQPDPLPVLPKKRVSFNINEKNSSSPVSFLNKLKKKDTTLSTIKEEEQAPTPRREKSELLSEILNYQKKTLEAITELTIFLQTQFSQSQHPALDTPSK